MPPEAAAAAILYDPEGYETRGARLMGRHAAGEGFLTALVRHGGFDPLVALVPGRPQAEAFARQVAALGGTMRTEAIGLDSMPALSRTGCVMLPGPDIGGFAWRRRRHDQRGYSLVGVTHTTASERAMDSIADLLTAPVQPWDALICTSRAVAAMARAMLEQEAAYLRRRLGATRFELPELPVIPLGVDCDAFAPDPAWRAAWRAKLGIAEGDAAVLMLGRLSFHAKAHPHPMYLALGRAAAAVPGRRTHLILAGWFANDGQRDVFVKGAAALCPGVALHVLDGRLPDVRRQVWSAADVFTLLSDNIQETFGLAPLEGMAAGLPVVVSDWDGFRDTVEHGVHGFRVPTLMAGPQEELADRHAAALDSYDSYIGGAAMFAAVDIPAAAEAYRALIADPALARRMGEAGRLRARRDFDWAVVVGRYKALWAELAARRAAAGAEPRAPRGAGEEAMPRRPDPARAFAGYPTRHLGPDTRLAPAPGADAALLRALLAIPGSATRPELLPAEAQMAAVLARLAAEGPLPAAELARGLAPAAALRLHRALAWMAKLDLLRPLRD